jgi:hypothetical protein
MAHTNLVKADDETLSGAEVNKALAEDAAGNMGFPDTGTAALPSLYQNGDTDTGIWSPAANTLAISTAGSEAMRIDSSGKVGINTASPTKELSVSGAGHFYKGGVDSTLDAALGIAASFYSINDSNGVGPQILTVDNGDTAEANRWVGFKTREENSTSPTTIVQDNDLLLSIEAYGANGSAYTPSSQIQFAVDGTPGVNDMPGRITFLTTPDNSATPAERMRIASTGAIQMNAYGAGTATFDGSGNITSVSDESLKDIQRPFTRGLDDIIKITPQTFKWNKKSGLEQELEYSGFIAQDLEAAIPEAVYGETGSKTVMDRAVIAALVNAVKELSAQVEILKQNQQ